MGVLYSVMPCTEEMAQWCQDFEVIIPIGAGRHPTPAELRRVVQHMSGVTADVQLRGSGQLDSIGLHTRDQNGELSTTIRLYDVVNEATPVRIGFAKGDEALILATVIALTALTGPLVIFEDSSVVPLLVSATDTVPALLAAWNLARE